MQLANHRFNVTRSQYSDTKSTICSEIEGRGLLNVGINQAFLQQQKQKFDELQRESDKFKNQFSKVESRITGLEQKTTDLLAERRKVEHRSTMVGVAKEKLERHIAKLNRMKANMIGNMNSKYPKDFLTIFVLHYRFGSGTRSIDRVPYGCCT